MTMRFFTLCALQLLLGVAYGRNIGSHASDVLRFQSSGDPGVAKNCGPSPSPFRLTWTPKSPARGSLVTIDIDVTAPKDLPSGTVNAKVWMANIPNPVVQTVTPFTCEQLKKKVPGLIACPIKKGQRLKVTMPYLFKAESPVPSGQFRLQANVTTDKGEEFLCAELNLVLKG